MEKVGVMMYGLFVGIDDLFGCLMKGYDFVSVWCVIVMCGVNSFIIWFVVLLVIFVE